MKKNTILRTITYFCGLLFILSVACLDSESILPFIGCLVSGAWIVLFTYANTWWYPEDRKNKK